MDYTIIETDSSFCPECDKPVVLLRADDSPSFYICFDCKFVARIGVGRVESYTLNEPAPEEVVCLESDSCRCAECNAEYEMDAREKGIKCYLCDNPGMYEYEINEKKGYLCWEHDNKYREDKS